MKKKHVHGKRIPINFIPFYRIMKLCVLFVIILNFSAVAGVNAQAKRVTLTLKNVELRQVFKELKRQTGVRFFYNEEKLRNQGVQQIDIQDEELDKALNEILKKTSLTHTILRDVVVIKDKDMSQTPSPIKEKRTIKGTVKDNSGLGLPGVSVLIKGTLSGVATDIDGKFEMTVEDNPNLVLQFSFVGMELQEIKIGTTDQWDITLLPTVESLDEVVVTGYQTISKERSPGSFAVVSPTDMNGKLQNNILNRMEGLVAGLVSYKGNIQIRGVSTINGIKTPLYVVDGVPFEGTLDAINPADIINVTVLKDATAASIYGARSANGVIVITTRRGTPGKIKVSYNGTVKFTPLPDRDYANLMNSEELVNFQVDMFKAYHNPSLDIKRAESPIYLALYANEAGDLSDADLQKELDKYRGQNNYDQIVDEFLRKQEITHQHNLSISGGSDFHQYMLSLNYQGDSPYERSQHSDRVGFNMKNSFQFTNWLKADVGVIGSELKSDYDNGIGGMSLLNGGVASYQLLRDEKNNPLQWYKEKSQYELDRLADLRLLNESYFPANELNKSHYTYKNQYLNLNVGLNIKLIEGLTVDLRYQTEKGRTYTKQYYTKDAWYVKNMINNATQMSGGVPKYNIPMGGQMREMNENTNSFTLRAQVNFNRTFKDIHDLTVIAGAERRKVVRESSGQYKVGYDDHNLTYKNINELDLQGTIYGTESPNGTFFYNTARPPFTNVENRYVAFYGNASYTYNSRLSASASVRIDQSNLFGTDPKYQYRPLWSTGLQYVICENQWDWLDKLSARVTYGINGNISKQSGPYLIAEPSRYANYLTNENYNYISTPPNSGLRWEKTKVTNIGLDFLLLNTRLFGSIEYYSKNTSDLLGDRAADPTIGWSTVMMNYGDMRNRGMELTLRSKNIVHADFSWTSDFTFSLNKNKITKITNQSVSASSYLNNLQVREDYPLNSLFSVRYAGLDERGAPTAYKKNGEIVKSTTALTKDDLVYSGTYDPPYNASLSNTFSYKGIDLSFMFVYYGGHVLRDVSAGTFLDGPNTAYTTNIDREFSNYWRKPEDSQNIRTNPAPHYNVSRSVMGIWQGADIHIQKGDFIKLRDLTVGYTLPQEWIQQLHLQQVRVDLQVQNVWRWAANDKKLDPEVWNGGAINSLSRGNLTPTTYTLGLAIHF